MNDDIGKIVSECLNDNLIKHYFLKTKNMTYTEKKKQEKNFAKMIGYCVLFREKNGIEDYMRLYDKQEQIEFLKARIANKLNIPSDEIDKKQNDIVSYAFENFVKNGYVFHGGNSKAIEDNMKHGLKGAGTSQEEKDELMYIDSIFSKYGDDHPLGWGILDIKNNRSGWFYDNTPKHMLYYSESPEWFRQFCGGNICYAWGTIPEENRHGYANRDYDTCLMAITTLINKNKMEEKDRQEIIDFFNKCWSKFGDTEPYLAFVPIKSLSNDEQIEYFKTQYIEDDYLQKHIFEEIIEGGCIFFNNNACSDKDISPEDLSCVNLSPILPRFKINLKEQQREKTISDCIRKLNKLDLDDLLKAQEIIDQLSNKNNGRSL